jgi:hypothetical protein
LRVCWNVKACLLNFLRQVIFWTKSGQLNTLFNVV